MYQLQMKCPKCQSNCATIFKPQKGWRCIVCWIFYPDHTASAQKKPKRTRKPSKEIAMGAMRESAASIAVGWVEFCGYPPGDSQRWAEFDAIFFAIANGAR